MKDSQLSFPGQDKRDYIQAQFADKRKLQTEIQEENKENRHLEQSVPCVALSKTQVTLFLPRDINGTESDLIGFICVSADGLCVSLDALYAHITVVRQTELAVDLAGEQHEGGKQLSQQEHASALYGPVPPGLNDGTTVTLACLAGGTGPSFELPSNATVKAGPGKWQLLS